MCKNSNCYIDGSKTYDGYCKECYIYLNPNSLKAISAKFKKSSAMMEMIKEHFNGYIQPKPLEDLQGANVRIWKDLGEYIIGINLSHTQIDLHNVEYDGDKKLILIHDNDGKFIRNGKTVNPTTYNRLVELKRVIEEVENRRVFNEEIKPFCQLLTHHNDGIY